MRGFTRCHTKGACHMARKNRVSVYDGVYHVTTRIANSAMLLKTDEGKERMMK